MIDGKPDNDPYGMRKGKKHKKHAQKNSLNSLNSLAWRSDRLRMNSAGQLACRVGFATEMNLPSAVKQCNQTGPLAVYQAASSQCRTAKTDIPARSKSASAGACGQCSSLRPVLGLAELHFPAKERLRCRNCAASIPMPGKFAEFPHVI